MWPLPSTKSARPTATRSCLGVVRVDRQLRERASSLLSDSIRESARTLSAAQCASFARRLESAAYAVFFASGGTEDYAAMVQDLAANMRSNGAMLCPKYSPEEVVMLDDATLAAGTYLEREQHDLRAVQAKLTALLSNAASSAGDEESAAAIRCGKCRGTDIETNQRQTRGADEAMTTFCKCNKCGKRWKM